MKIEETMVLYEYISEVDPTTYNIAYGSNEKYPTSVINECRKILKKKADDYFKTWKRWQELGDIEQISLEEIQRMDSLKRDENGIVYIDVADVDVEVPKYSFDEFKEIIKDEESKKRYMFIYNTLKNEDRNSSISRIAAGYTILNRLNSGSTVEYLIINKDTLYPGYNENGGAKESLENRENDDLRNEVLAVMQGDVENPIGNRTLYFGRYKTYDVTFVGEQVEDCIVVGSDPDFKNVFYFEYETLHNKGSYAEGIVIFDYETKTWSINSTEE